MFRFSSLASLVVASMIAAAPALASDVVQGDPAAGGIGYTWSITMGEDDLATAVRHVGALSHNDPINFSEAPLTGWTHTSDWVALELTNATNLTILLERMAGVPNGAGTAGGDLYPAFSIYEGWDNDGGDSHIYNNAGTFDWAEDLTSFIGAEHNGVSIGTNTPAPGLTSVEHTFTLPAGFYSIALGGNPVNSVGSGRQGYQLTLTTTAVPEVGTMAMSAIGLLVVGATALRRRFAAK